MAQAFDANSLRLTREPVAVGERVVDVDTNPFTFAFFSVSTNGVLAYQAGAADTQLVWFDRAGKRLGAVDMPGYKAVPKLSPDGKQVALERGDPQTGKNTIWLLELSRGAASRFTFEADHSYAPVWSLDGSRIAYASLRDGIRYLYQKLSTGAQNEELLLKFGKEFSYPTDWSSDGQFIAYTIENAKTKRELWVLPLKGDRKPFPFLQTQFNEMNGRFSPDGRWMAYTSDESGKSEVYVRKFSRGAAGGKWQISTQGGIDPIWRRDGKELFYIGADRKLMAVEVKAGELKVRPLFEPSVPKALFDTGMKFDAALPYAVAADGQRLLVITQAAEEKPQPTTVVFNWPAGLKR
jgi:Tol biopolymer transport system component